MPGVVSVWVVQRFDVFGVVSLHSLCGPGPGVPLTVPGVVSVWVVQRFDVFGVVSLHSLCGPGLLRDADQARTSTPSRWSITSRAV